MRKPFTGAIALLVALSWGNSAFARPGRIVTRDYLVVRDSPTILPPGTGSGAKFAAFVTFRSRPHDTSIDIVIRDDTRLDVAADVLQDLDGDGEYEISSAVCGRSESPIPIVGGHQVVVALREGPCTNSSIAPVRGTVTVTFRRDWPGRQHSAA